MSPPRERLSLAAARRVALAAQGFADPLPTGPATRRHIRRVVGRTNLLQIDSVNVFQRAHYLPAFSRLGSYDITLVDRLAYRDRELFEYWGHEASLLPVALHPLLRWRMERARNLEEGWGGMLRTMRDRPEFVADVLRMVRERGPVGAGELREGERNKGAWWTWDETKVALRVYTTSLSVGTRATRADAPRLLITGLTHCRSKNRPYPRFMETVDGAPAAWLFADAWLMVAARGFGRRGCDLSQLIASADAHNHDIPTEEVLRRSIGRLCASGLMAVMDLQVHLTGDGLALAKRATGGMFQRGPNLLRLLNGWPLTEGVWDDLPQGAWQDAYDKYRARSKHM